MRHHRHDRWLGTPQVCPCTPTSPLRCIPHNVYTHTPRTSVRQPLVQAPPQDGGVGGGLPPRPPNPAPGSSAVPPAADTSGVRAAPGAPRSPVSLLSLPSAWPGPGPGPGRPAEGSLARGGPGPPCSAADRRPQAPPEDEEPPGAGGADRPGAAARSRPPPPRRRRPAGPRAPRTGDARPGAAALESPGQTRDCLRRRPAAAAGGGCRSPRSRGSAEAGHARLLRGAHGEAGGGARAAGGAGAHRPGPRVLPGTRPGRRHPAAGGVSSGRGRGGPDGGAPGTSPHPRGTVLCAPGQGTGARAAAVVPAARGGASRARRCPRSCRGTRRCRSRARSCAAPRRRPTPACPYTCTRLRAPGNTHPCGTRAPTHRLCVFLAPPWGRPERTYGIKDGGAAGLGAPARGVQRPAHGCPP